VAAHALASDVARLHGDELLRTAKKASMCADDAHDAYQRALMLLLEHAAGIERSKAVGWMHVVVRREASAIRKARDRTVPFEDEDVDQALRRLATAPDEQVHAIDLAHRAGEALAALKDTEAQALCLRAQGLSYEEIGELHGWSYTKVNRAIAEGRKAFVSHYTAVEQGAVCATTESLLEPYIAGELGMRATARVRAHLVHCSACRAQFHAARDASQALHALLPPAIIGSATALRGTGWLHDHILAPIGHLAGRLQPAADHLVSSKLGLVAASALAVAGGGAAVQHERHQPKPPLLRPALTARAPGSQAAPISGLITTAIKRDATLAQRRAAAAQRRAAAKRRRAARKRAAAHEFSTTGEEFASAASPSAQRGQRASTGSTPEVVAAPETEVTTSDEATGATVEVESQNSGASKPQSPVEAEFSP
jgi:RNA polymerase sigma factor (sigma-70 family)